MENLKKSKRIALGILEDTKAFNYLPNKSNHDNEIDIEPSTSNDKNKRPNEYVKYSKITFNTTAILHHYPQLSQNRSEEVKPQATKKSDLNLPIEQTQDNNNDVVENNGKSDNYNNNSEKINFVSISDNTIEVLNQPVKFTEEKLV